MRADFQQFYGIDIERAAAGAHSARHVAALLSCLPPESRTVAALAPDASWTRLEVLQAMTFNALAAVFGGEDAPQVPIPGADNKQDARHIAGQAMTPEELMEILSKPRTPTPENGGGE